MGLRAYLKMVFIDGVFHGDLHAGNFFILPQNKIGLIDFGVVGRLNRRGQTAIANMLVALSQEDYERLAYEYIDLSPFNEDVDVDQFAKELRDLIAPYYGLTLKNFNFGRLLLSSSSIASKNHVSVPTELMLFFKSLVGIESIGRKIKSDFDFLSTALEFAGDLVKHQYDPNRMMQEWGGVLSESKSVIRQIPRQIHYLFRKWNSPNAFMKIQIHELEDLKKSIELSYNLLFLGIIIASLILSSSFIYVHQSKDEISGMPAMSFTGYAFALGLGVIAFFNYIKK